MSYYLTWCYPPQVCLIPNEIEGDMKSHRMRESSLAFARQQPGIDVEALSDCLTLGEFFDLAFSMHDDYMASHGLSARRFEVMESLFHTPDHCLTPAELAEYVGQTRQAMTSTLDGLEKRKLVERTAHPKDRRMTLVRLTPEGTAYIKGVLVEHYAGGVKLVKYLDPEERKMMSRIHQKLVMGLRDLMKEKNLKCSGAK